MSPTPDSTPHVAVVGAGPSGFYAALALLGNADPPFAVDVLDRLPAPYGLVRYGVAPDHQKIKSVAAVFQRGVERAGDRFRFLGNVEVGRDVSVAELQARYHAVVLAHGAQTDQRLGIAGEDLPGVYAARELVAWYNGHPDWADARFDLDAERAVVVGIGNVAIDVARILERTREELNATDIRPEAQAAIMASPIREVVIVARRGPAQAACTPAELRELASMAHADLVVAAEDQAVDPVSQGLLDAGLVERDNVKNLEVMREMALLAPRPDREVVRLRFYVSPEEILGTDRVTGIRLRRNELALRQDGKVVTRPTDHTEDVECGVVFRSIGYRIAPLPGVPYDYESDAIPHDAGQVLDHAGGTPVPGLFVTGWAKRGPTGIIGTNKPDAVETAGRLIDAWRAGRLAAPTAGSLEDLLAERGVQAVSYADWLEIDARELSAGAAVGRPRLKFARVEEMLRVLGESRGAPVTPSASS